MKHNSPLVLLGLIFLGLNLKAQVGIGTTSPSEILDLESSNATKTALDINNTGGGDPLIHFQIAGTAVYTAGVDNSDGDKFKIGTTAVETGTIFTIDGATVGIGTTSPTSTLTVNGNTELYQDLYIRGVLNNSSNQLRLYNNNTSTFIDFNGGDLYFRDEGATVQLTLQDATGFVGIGCNNPQYALHVVGDIASSATVRTTNALVTGAITACSDIRYKKDVTALPSSLENVMKLNGVTYYWKTTEFPSKNFSAQRQIGVIAQEVEKIYPELIFTDTDGYKSVDYSKFTPILLEAIKEQQKIIDQQQAEIDQQKQQFETLKASIEELKKNQAQLEAGLNLKKSN
ncbi:MAG: tail fiber domain-containing protein [Flavobacteriales bacterium]